MISFTSLTSLTSFVELEELETDAGALFLPLAFLVMGAELSELGELGGESFIWAVGKLANDVEGIWGGGVAWCDLLDRFDVDELAITLANCVFTPFAPRFLVRLGLSIFSPDCDLKIKPTG